MGQTFQSERRDNEQSSTAISVPVVPRQTRSTSFKKNGRYRTVVTCISIAIVLAAAVDLERSGSFTHFNDPALPNFPNVASPSIPRQDQSRNAAEITKKARRYHTGESVPEDHRMAFELYNQAARLGDGEAMNWIGLMLVEGDGVEKKPEQAKAWFEKAAAAGYSDGLANLGWIHQEGLGVEQDYELAHSWFRKGARKGNDEAMNRLGLLYADGLGTPKDPTEALRWFEMAAARGNSNGINNLGWLYRDGIGVATDFAKARGYFERAANMGNGVSAWSLSMLLDEGKGGVAAPAAAAERLLQAAKAGQKDAVAELGGTMEHWTVSTRTEVKRVLSNGGKYSGPIDGNWDEAAKEAVRKLMP